MRAFRFIVVFLVPCVLAPGCEKMVACHYPDTMLLGVPFRIILKEDIFPVTCATVCSLTEGCIGVTLDPLAAMCHLYGESASFGITPEVGTYLWLFQAGGGYLASR